MCKYIYIYIYAFNIIYICIYVLFISTLSRFVKSVFSGKVTCLHSFGVKIAGLYVANSKCKSCGYQVKEMADLTQPDDVTQLDGWSSTTYDMYTSILSSLLLYTYIYIYLHTYLFVYSEEGANMSAMLGKRPLYPWIKGFV